jgi:nucleoid-associated protein YejK
MTELTLDQIAKDPNTSVEDLVILSQNEDLNIRYKAYLNPNMTKESAGNRLPLTESQLYNECLTYLAMISKEYKGDFGKYVTDMFVDFDNICKKYFQTGEENPQNEK